MDSYLNGLLNINHGISGIYIKLASFVAICLAGVVIYSTGFGLFFPIEQRGGIFIASIFIVLCKLGSDRILKENRSPLVLFSLFVDILFLAAAVFATYRFMIVQRIMAEDLYDILVIDIVACFITGHRNYANISCLFINQG